MRNLLVTIGLVMLLGGCEPGDVVVSSADPVVYSSYPNAYPYPDYYGRDYFVVDAPIYFDSSHFSHQGRYHRPYW